MRIDFFIFGYKTIQIKTEDKAYVISQLIRRNLGAKISHDGKFDVPLGKTQKYINSMKNIEYTVSEPRGLPAVFISNRHRFGIFAGLLVLFFYFLFISGFVWDIRISGNENVPSEIIEKELSDIGFEVGSSWRSLSLNKVETDVLKTSENVGWININRVGNVAYVMVKEKTVYEQQEETLSFSNIVASVDCIIEEITVKSGIACVKAGDTVKKGDLLISGIIPAELGGGFVRAEGEVYGRVNEEIYVEVPRTEDIKTYGNEELYSTKIKIFKFSINIFKNYRKSQPDCAIIEDVEECVVFGKYRLPIEIYKMYRQPVIISERAYSDKELVSIASSRLAKLRVMKLSDAELLKVKTYGEFTDVGYKMTSSVTVLRDIGEERSFSN